MRLCKKCGEEKPVNRFSKCARYKYGLQKDCKDCFAAYYAATAEKRRANAREWVANNKERQMATRKAYKQSASGRAKIKSLKSKRRAQERGAHITDPLISSAFEIITEKYGVVCMHPDCDRMDIELDHVVPLSLGGTHSIDNLQVLCAHHNRSKGNRSCADYRVGA